MYLKSFKLEKFRKFYNEVQVDFASPYQKKEEDKANVASATTLIIGKNNAGKSTIVRALQIVSSSSPRFEAMDFNMRYLKELFESGKKTQRFTPPELSFEIVIGLRGDEDDLSGVMADLLSLGDLNALAQNALEDEEVDVVVKVRYQVKEEKAFEEKVKEKNPQRLEEYIDILDDCSFKTTYQRGNGEIIDNFNLSKILAFDPIEANGISSSHSLSGDINQLLLEYRELLFVKQENEAIDKQVKKLQEVLESLANTLASNMINDVLKRKAQGQPVETSLRAEMTFDTLMSRSLKCHFVDDEYDVPESQYGLGYVRLIQVVICLIKHSFKALKKSKINVVAIEEPETHMHPQMQERFMRYINDVLEEIEKNVVGEEDFRSSSQLLISTHSDHIIHSKIHDGNTFDFINYVSNRDGVACVIQLNDDKVIPNFLPTKKENENPDKSLRFLKKHISLSTSSIFFADGIILVEGLAEETLLPYYLAKDAPFSERYVSIIGVKGAHAHVYFELLKTLEIPSIVITDIDFEKKGNDYKQVTSLQGQKTSNHIILDELSEGETLQDLDGRLPCVRKCSKGIVGIYTQSKIGDFYPTSFEEAIILTNSDKKMLKDRLRENHKDIYEEIERTKSNEPDQNKEQSAKWQAKINKEKFATKLLYDLLTCEDEEMEIVLPNYILAAFDDLKENLGLTKDRS